MPIEKGKFFKAVDNKFSSQNIDKSKGSSPKEAAIAEGTIMNKMVKEAAELLKKQKEKLVNDYFGSKKEKISNRDREIEYVKPIERIRKIYKKFLDGKWDSEVVGEIGRLLEEKERVLSSQGINDEIGEIRNRMGMWSLVGVLRKTMNAGVSKKQIEKILGKKKNKGLQNNLLIFYFRGNNISRLNRALNNSHRDFINKFFLYCAP